MSGEEIGINYNLQAMKRIIFITVILSINILCFPVNVYGRIIEKPAVSTSFTKDAFISVINITSNSTDVTVDVSPILSESTYLVSISSKACVSYINPESGTSETKQIIGISDTFGVPLVLGKEYDKLPRNSFILKFPALPEGVERINLIEEGEWEWYGIDIAPEDKEESVSGMFSSADFDSDDEVLEVDTVCADTIDGDWDEYNPDYDDEYAVTSVAGIEFGDDRSTVMSQLHSRFGYSEEDEGNIVTFLNINVGGIQYNYAEFYFLKEKFVGAVLTKYFSINNFQTAKNYRDRIARQYGQKYRNITSEIDRNGMKYYLCGRLDYGFYPIIIDIQKSRGRDGVYRYYLKVKYNAYLIYAALESDI